MIDNPDVNDVMRKKEEFALYAEIASSRFSWMNEDQLKCFSFICDIVGGFHHLRAKPKPCGADGIEVNVPDGRWATFDFDYLTRLVIDAHNRMIRVDISGSGPGRIKLYLHQRHTRDGPMHARHPSIYEAVERYANRYSSRRC